MKLLVVSICMNEAKTIGQVLDGIPKKIKGVDSIEKWVIDDGSTDGTSDLARKHGAKVISDGANKKLAFRFREALELAMSRNADVLVNIDGDMQFDPKEIPLLVAPVVNDDADFVAADRFTDPILKTSRRPNNMPVGKFYGNKLGAWVVGKLSGEYFRDVTCGFRAYNKKAIISLNINSTYTYTQESFQVMAMKKMRIKAIPVSIKYFPGRKSRVVKSFGQFVFGSALNILRAYRDYAPLRFFGSLGLLFFIPAVVLLSFSSVHYAGTGLFSPYKAVGLTGLYLLTMSLFIWALGLAADMLDRMLNNQEKILEIQKRQQYGLHNKTK
ncbi:MAG: glycosyltransferase involved in cell wall biosynthesis [Francisellaceae bacterium]|jgi:glycosyltransferase involved in cell wall biosynthesis